MEKLIVHTNRKTVNQKPFLQNERDINFVFIKTNKREKEKNDQEEEK